MSTTPLREGSRSRRGRPEHSGRLTAGYHSPQRVTGDLGGRRGTFLLQDAGTVQDKIVSGDWFVIAGSGTQELTGLRGEGGFRANLGENAEVHLDYWFE